MIFARAAVPTIEVVVDLPIVAESSGADDVVAPVVRESLLLLAILLKARLEEPLQLGIRFGSVRYGVELLRQPTMPSQPEGTPAQTSTASRHVPSLLAPGKRKGIGIN